ncbi:sugar O-acetyltransferase [Marinilactibacillus kalidii]|uniref:sugar O-acetyltransferase n=1 Tax=Marinilactibacillus kalidii TaxID=2820274 RepID=UPI001ABE0BD2|nr:sugar O-acetyltransferase [Marinilactibacillus kalidii]
MQTEKNKMIAGKHYKPGDEELVKARVRAHTLAKEYNQLPVEQERTERIKELFGYTGNKLHVEPGLRIDYGFNVSVGEMFYANFDLVLLDTCPIVVGDNAMFGPRVSLVTPEHPLDPVERNSGIEFGRPITIGDNCWIGSDATIIGGVTLGNNVVVGAGSVVTKSFGDNVVIAGNPAGVIKTIEP